MNTLVNFVKVNITVKNYMIHFWQRQIVLLLYNKIQYLDGILLTFQLDRLANYFSYLARCMDKIKLQDGIKPLSIFL